MNKFGLTIILSVFILLIASFAGAASGGPSGYMPGKYLGSISGQLEIRKETANIFDLNSIVQIYDAMFNDTDHTYFNSVFDGMGPLKFYATMFTNSNKDSTWQIKYGEEGNEVTLFEGRCESFNFLPTNGTKTITFMCYSSDLGGFELTVDGEFNNVVDITDIYLSFSNEAKPTIIFSNGDPLEIVLGDYEDDMIYDFSAQDRIGNDLTDSVEMVLDDFDPTYVDEYTITYSVTDATGLRTTIDRIVTIAQGDTLLPKIIGKSPNEDETDVSVNKNIQVIFSKFMDTSTITFDTFYLYKNINDEGNPEPIDGELQQDNMDNTTITFNPTKDLEYGVIYTVVIKKDDVIGGTPGVMDKDGLTLANDVIWSFETATGDEDTHGSGNKGSGGGDSSCFIKTLQ